MQHSAILADKSGDQDRRGVTRPVSVLRVARLTSETGDQLCVVRNVSPTGLMGSADEPPEYGTRVGIEFSTDVKALGEVRWVKGDRFGVEFDDSTDILGRLDRPAGRLRRQRVRAPRFARNGKVRLSTPVRTVSGEVVNISLNGVKIAAANSGLEVAARLKLSIAGLPKLAGQVRWVRADVVGIWFERPLRYDELAAWLIEIG